MIVAIGGFTASGKSSLAKALSLELRWPNISAGAYFRKMAEERNIDIFELSTLAVDDPEIDQQVTEQVLGDIVSSSDCILDAHAACLVASSLDHVSLLLHCPTKERARRLAQRTGFTPEESLHKIETFDRETTLRMYHLYGQDFMDLSGYHLVINTAKTDVASSLIIAKCLVGQIWGSRK
jgi:cytidylate kinase